MAPRGRRRSSARKRERGEEDTIENIPPRRGLESPRERRGGGVSMHQDDVRSEEEK